MNLTRTYALHTKIHHDLTVEVGILEPSAYSLVQIDRTAYIPMMRMTQKESSTLLRRSSHSSRDKFRPFAMLTRSVDGIFSGESVYLRFHYDHAQFLHFIDPRFKLVSEARYVPRPLVRPPKRLALVRFFDRFVEINAFVVLPQLLISTKKKCSS